MPLKQKKSKSKPLSDPEPYEMIQMWNSQLKIQRGNQIKYGDAESVKKYQVKPKIDCNQQNNANWAEQELEWENDMGSSDTKIETSPVEANTSLQQAQQPSHQQQQNPMPSLEQLQPIEEQQEDLSMEDFDQDLDLGQCL